MQVILARLAPGHRRASPSQQRPAGRRDPLVASGREVRDGFPQPGHRIAPAVGEGRLGHEAPRVMPVPGHERPHLRVRGGECGFGFPAAARTSSDDGVGVTEQSRNDAVPGRV